MSSFNTPPLYFQSHDSFLFIFLVELRQPTQLFVEPKVLVLILDGIVTIHFFNFVTSTILSSRHFPFTQHFP